MATVARPTFAAVQRRLSPGLALAYKLTGGDAVEVSADGVRVKLSDGREMLDFGSYGVTLLGHRHPSVVDAVVAQCQTMPTATRSVANPVTAAFADELAGRCGPGLERVWLGTDGADAVEAAIKLARRRTGRPMMLAARGGFHGKTLGALALTSTEPLRAGLEPLLTAVQHLDPDDPDAAGAALEAGNVAGIIVEPIRGENGVRPLDPKVARRWAEDARGAGAYLIADEVQVGLGRCGPFSLAQAAGLRPDAVLFGKSLGGGLLPLSAAVCTADLHEPLTSDPTWHTSTFGGHPLACAAGRAALRALDELAGDAALLSATCADCLDRLAMNYPEVVAETRGAGLLWAIEMRSPALAGTMLVELAQRGLLVSPCLSDLRSIRLFPAMVTTPVELREGLTIVEDAVMALVEIAPRLA